MTPFYDEGGITIYHGDYRSVWPRLASWDLAVLVTDPPYGIRYKSNSPRENLADCIEGDEDTSLRDDVLELWGDAPALVFGTWRIPRPAKTQARLIWDTKGALGMGDTTMPWKPADAEIYVLGHGVGHKFTGHRGSNVLRYAPVQSMAKNGRVHPHEKPVDLMRALLMKCPPGVIFDPFCGSGSTLRAAKDLGRKAIGVEIELRYCQYAASRCGQEVLELAS